MFRDETVKVEKRVRASWGMSDASSSSSTSTITSSTTSQSAPVKSKRSASIAPTARSGASSIPTPPASVLSTSPVSTQSPPRIRESPSPTTPSAFQSGDLLQGSSWEALALHSPVATNPNDLGLSFYVNHYILGYPDEVKRGEDLSGELWFQSPASQATMTALGLAGLGNLHNDKQLQLLSKIKYGEALACTNQALRDPLKNLDAAIRATIMLALYQCVHTTHQSHENVRVHLLGCMALIKSAIPIRSVPAMGIRGLLQLCYSLLVPCIQTGVGLPDNFFQWVRDSGSSDFLPPDEKPGATLAHIIARFAQLNATIRNTAYTDGREPTARMLRQLVAVECDMKDWEASRTGKWRYQVHRHPALPAEAVFRHQYHRYSDVWTSRIWNHFRWARILTNQAILELAERYPTSAAGIVSPGQRDRIHDTIRRLAADVLTSAPTHYKHPRLTRAHLDIIQTHGGAGAGAVGIPHLMFQLQVAACAPGVPYGIWRWALGVMETAWGELGMMHIKSLAEVLRGHRPDAEDADVDGERV